ncbi:hypothetical protein K505DRAFT_367589 [Melanomma pulvis-pyrius CBS 109.77]|uniref:Saccharopine dehydrogenase NADP binding domain-containing protein n=1 Tax=Melanomma pulvis-pyrius CBS 109.77 TaxID=1314802 RepID=A0A6A6WSQ3_9PLEO|nr:hypothetical protein K505DRAFT_367589 [Melanomma pulvis-pyrius CBS 109.77]
MNTRNRTSNSRQYDLILLGATGYTGRFTAQHITASLPTDLKWAIAGRSRTKLAIIAEDLKKQNGDRIQPEIEVCELVGKELDTLAKKTQLIITTIGPYVKFGTPVVEACANNGTHYVDCSGEIPWHLDIIKAYHDRARASGAIMIPQCGFDSVPADLIAYSLATYIRRTFKSGTLEVIVAMDSKSAPSGGSLNTLFTGPEHHTPAQVAAAYEPFALSSTQPPPASVSTPMSWRKWLLGTRWDRDLRELTSCFQSTLDTALVQRSWGLFENGKLYGENFGYSEWAVAGSSVGGAFGYLNLRLVMWMMSQAPVRWLMKRFAFQPSEGPDAEATKHDYAHFRAIGLADNPGSDRAVATFKLDGSLYYFTGLAIAEAAMVILRGGDNEARRCGGGILTPATLGEEFIERLTKQTDLKIEITVGRL